MRSTKATVRQRVDEVLNLRLLGAELYDLQQHASQQGWGVSDRQLQRYVAAADDLLSLTLEKDREKLLNRHIAQRRALFARAASVSDHGTCARLLKDEADLLGLYPPKGINIGGQGGPVVVEIVEEVTGGPAPTPPGTAEEAGAADGAANDPPANQTPPGAESVPRQ
jgi:hypothetical protein